MITIVKHDYDYSHFYFEQNSRTITIEMSRHRKKIQITIEPFNEKLIGLSISFNKNEVIPFLESKCHQEVIDYVKQELLRFI